MTTVISILAIILFVWTGHSTEWMVDYATGQAQAAIWCTLASQVPFLSLWVSLKQSSGAAMSEIPSTTLRTHWSSFLKYSCIFTFFYKRTQQKSTF